MNGREHFLNILSNKSPCCGFWHGRPHRDSEENLFSYFGVKDDFELGAALGDCACWCFPDPADFWKEDSILQFLQSGNPNAPDRCGILAEAETPEDLDALPWPDPSHCDFSAVLERIGQAKDAGMAVLSGVWAPFFHDVSNIFGMEEYFIRMYTNPDLVQAVTRRIVDFYLKANEMLLSQAEGSIDCYFFGNDYGSQLDLLVSPAAFREFILPYTQELIRQGIQHGCKIANHSCGAISRVIPDLIASGVDVLHPIQAKARDMDAQSLQSRFGGQVHFMGGIDMQELLTFGTPDQIFAEVHRVCSILGPNYIISPSHECILPNVPPVNLEALAAAALKEKERFS